METKTMSEAEVTKKLEKFALMLRLAAHGCGGGFYADEAELSREAAKKEVYDEIARAMDSAFGFDTQDSRLGCRMRLNEGA